VVAHFGTQDIELALDAAYPVDQLLSPSLRLHPPPIAVRQSTTSAARSPSSNTAYAHYVVKVPARLDSFDAAPLTCAGVRTYKAVKVAGTRSSDFVAVFGVGGLGHLAIQYSAIAGGRVVAVDSARFGAWTGDARPVDSMIHDGLWDAFNDIRIGITAENLVEQYGLAARNRTSSRPAGSKRPSAPSRRGLQGRDSADRGARDGRTRQVVSDENARPGTTAGAPAKLRAAFRREHGDRGECLGDQPRGVGGLRDVGGHGQRARLRTVGTGRELRVRRGRAGDHGHRPRACCAQGAGQGGARTRHVDLFELNEASRRDRCPCSGSWTSTPS
jgi:Thiolase, N-terminal domain